MPQHLCWSHVCKYCSDIHLYVIWVQWWRYLKRVIYSLKARSCNKMHYSTALPSHTHVLFIWSSSCITSLLQSVNHTSLPCLVFNHVWFLYVVSDLSQGEIFTFCHETSPPHVILFVWFRLCWYQFNLVSSKGLYRRFFVSLDFYLFHLSLLSSLQSHLVGCRENPQQGHNDSIIGLFISAYDVAGFLVILEKWLLPHITCHWLVFIKGTHALTNFAVCFVYCV